MQVEERFLIKNLKIKQQLALPIHDYTRVAL